MRPTTIELAAIAAHEANRAYCMALGDFSQKPWEKSPKWQTDSAIKGAEFIQNNPNAGPSASHVSWLEEKEVDGWTYGEVKDADAKTHPCYVPYEELPKSQRLKDSIFSSVVQGVLSFYAGD